MSCSVALIPRANAVLLDWREVRVRFVGEELAEPPARRFDDAGWVGIAEGAPSWGSSDATDAGGDAGAVAYWTLVY